MPKFFKFFDNALDPIRKGGKAVVASGNNDNLFKTVFHGTKPRRRIPNQKPNKKFVFNNIDKNKMNKTAQNMGFKNAVEFDNYIKKINPHKLNSSDVPKVSRIFKYLSKRGGTIAKLAIAGGSLSAMLIYLKKFQNKHSGCFRYDNDDEEIRYKFEKGSFFCSNDDDDDDNLKLLAIEKHPLYNVKKWDCNYNKFGNKKEIDEILQLGCKGLCDWKNFNILAKTTKGEYNPISNDDDKYIYKCERMSLLKALSTSTGNAMNEIISGLFNSDLGQNIANFLIYLCLVFIIILMFFIIIHYYKNNRKLKKRIT